MRTRTWCVVGALVCLATPAMGQSVLSEADALARLSTDSPRVRAIRASSAVARADIVAAGRWPNPRFTYNRESVAGVTENMFLVTQPLPVTGRRGLEIEAATARADAQDRRSDDAIRQARSELRVAYADLAAAQARESELVTARSRLDELVQILASRERAGDAAGYDFLRAQRELTELDTELSAARDVRARARGALGGFFASPADASAMVVSSPNTANRSPLPTVEELVAKARTVRGDALALQKEAEAAQLAARAAERRGVPEPEIVAGTKSSNVGAGDVGTVFSVHVPIPLFDHGQPERAVARAQATQAEAQLAAFNTELNARIASLHALVLERRTAADRYRAASGSSAELERIAQVSYEAGERGILELLDAYRSGANARAKQVRLDVEAREAEIELEFVSGWEVR